MDTTLSELQLRFDNDLAEPTGLPFWAWNDKLDGNELIRQIHQFQKMGMRGFFMHSRTGLLTEYLSEEWFALINRCADEAEKIGMESFLYDEDRWPSGTVGGIVSSKPENRMKSIRLTILSGQDFQMEQAANALELYSCKLNGFVCTELEPISTATDPQTYQNKQILLFEVVEMPLGNFYNGATYIDTLAIEPTLEFLKLTHDRYLEKCGKRIGSSIVGIFTDEPHRGALLDGFGIESPDGMWRLPYTPKLFEEFRSRFGYELAGRLPELFLQLEGKTVSQLKFHYTELLQQLFLENYAIPCYDYCRRHNLKLTGHILHEDSLTAQCAMSGSMMRYYPYMDIPGIDNLCEHNSCFWAAKQLQSVGRQYGKKLLLSEMYGATGWNLPLQKHKTIGDWQALFGINRRCHHISWYSMRGEAKRDYPASIFYQSSYCGMYHYLERYFARAAEVLSAGEPVADVLVINPVESLWCQFYPGWSRNLCAINPRIVELESIYRDTFFALQNAQIDFDYGDEGLIAETGRIEQTDTGPRFIINQAAYKVVVVSGMETMRSTTWELLRKFQQLGGRVIYSGDVPAYLDAMPSDAVEILSKADGAIRVCTPAELPDAVTPNIRFYGIWRTVGEAAPEGIFVQTRKFQDGMLFAALNTRLADAMNCVTLTLPEPADVEIWDMLTGNRTPAGKKVAAVTFNFAPGEWKFIVTTKNGSDLPMPQEHRELQRFFLKGPYSYELGEPNAALLDMVRVKIADEAEYSPLMYILQADRRVREKLGVSYRGGDMLQPYLVAKQMAGKPHQTIAVALEFSFECAVLPPAVRLAIEDSAKFQIRLNGIEVPVKKHEHDFWVDHAFDILELPAAELRKGMNYLELFTNYAATDNLEAVYLLGDFGVYSNHACPTIGTLPAMLEPGDWSKAGLANYGGLIRLKLPLPLESRGKFCRFALPELDATGAVLSVHDKKYPLICQPQEIYLQIPETVAEAILEIAPSRINIFGPLHQFPAVDGACGPENFLTSGEHFTERPSLRSMGLPQEPVLTTFTT